MSGSLRSGFVALYTLRLDRDWRTLEMQASVLGSAKCIYLRRTEDGHWFDASGRLLQHLNGIVDVDLSITPFTNSLPIRRLKLGVGESVEITTAYVAFPHLELSADPQRYTRITSDRYRYEALGRGFAREVSLDADGFAITYPSLFQRIA